MTDVPSWQFLSIDKSIQCQAKFPTQRPIRKHCRSFSLTAVYVGPIHPFRPSFPPSRSIP